MSSSRRSKSRRYKRILGNALVVVLGLITVLLLVGLFLPRGYRVERQVDVKAPVGTVYENLVALRRWPEWTVWNVQMDPTVQFSFDSPDAGVGAAYRWTGKKLGRGSLKLTKAEAGKGVWYDLEFNGGETRAEGSVTLEVVGDHVRVVWMNEGDLGKNPVNRYVGLFMDRMLGGDLAGGLANLKRLVEGGGAK